MSGAFGLARVRMVVGDREGAVEALARVPAASSMHVAARVAGVRALASPVAAAPAPSAGQLERASLILDQLYLDPRRRGLMTIELYESSLTALASGATAGGGTVLGRPLTESAMRKGLEAELRKLARLAASVRERNDLVDQANRVRRRTLL